MKIEITWEGENIRWVVRIDEREFGSYYMLEDALQTAKEAGMARKMALHKVVPRERVDELHQIYHERRLEHALLRDELLYPF